MRLLNTRLGRNDKKFNAEAWIKETVNDDKGFFRYLYWVVLFCIMMIVLSMSVDIRGGDMDIYTKAQRINNG